MNVNGIEASTQTSFDYRDLADADDRAFVKERASLIRETAKRTAQGIVLIGQWLAEAKARLPHGSWLPWLRSEFGWSERTAYNFIGVYKACELANFANLEIDVSALYLIAAPKTPEPVRKEVIRRAKTGESMTRAKAEEVLEQYGQRSQLPSPTVARQIAIATNTPTAASNNTFVLPMTAAAEESFAAEQHSIRSLYAAITEVAETKLTPTEMLAGAERFFCRSLAQRVQKAITWLISVKEELDEKAHQA
jgi:hypothetical protein